MAIALHPTIVTSRSRHFVEVATDCELTRGMTVVDRLNVASNERNCDTWAVPLAAHHKAEVLWAIDNARWKEALYSTLR